MEAKFGLFVYTTAAVASAAFLVFGGDWFEEHHTGQEVLNPHLLPLYFVYAAGSAVNCLWEEKCSNESWKVMQATRAVHVVFDSVCLTIMNFLTMGEADLGNVLIMTMVHLASHALCAFGYGRNDIGLWYWFALWLLFAAYWSFVIFQLVVHFPTSLGVGAVPLIYSIALIMEDIFLPIQTIVFQTETHDSEQYMFRTTVRAIVLTEIMLFVVT